MHGRTGRPRSDCHRCHAGDCYPATVPCSGAIHIRSIHSVCRPDGRGHSVAVLLLQRGYGRRPDVSVKTSAWLMLLVLRGCGKSEEHTSELQSRFDIVCRLLLEKKKLPLAGEIP